MVTVYCLVINIQITNVCINKSFRNTVYWSETCNCLFCSSFDSYHFHWWATIATILGVELKLLNVLLFIGQLYKGNLTFTIVYSHISSFHITEMHKQQKWYSMSYLSPFIWVFLFLFCRETHFVSSFLLSSLHSLVSLTDRLGMTKSKSIWAFIKFGRLPSKDI